MYTYKFHGDDYNIHVTTKELIAEQVFLSAAINQEIALKEKMHLGSFVP